MRDLMAEGGARNGHHGSGFDVSVQTSHNHTRSLDGLRGSAALMVVLSHIFLGYFPSLLNGQVVDAVPRWVNALATSPMTFFYRGGLAVMIFFVLSGYVLTHGYVVHGDNAYIARATLKRYVRLDGPVFVACLLGCAIFHVDILVSLKEGLYGALLYSQTRSNYVLWTISYEFYGSLLVFGLLGTMGAFRPVCIAAFACCAIFLLAQDAPFIYFGLFAVGGLLRLCRRNLELSVRWKQLLGAVLLFGGAWLGAYQSNIPPYAVVARISNFIQFELGIPLAWPLLYQGLGAAIMVCGFLLCSAIHPIFASPAMAWLGRISFGCYLLHPFVLSLVEPWVKAHLGGGTRSLLACLCLVVLATFLAAHIFYRWVDRPSVNLANRFARWAIRERAIAP